MFDEFKKSLKASLYERTASPIIGAFASAWLIFNWKLCFIIAFANDSIYDRLTHIEKGPYIDIWPNLYFPAIAAAIFIGLYPLVSLLPYMWWEWYAKKKAEIKNSMQRGVLLSLEKSIELRNEIDNQEAKFEEMLKSKEQKNAELLVIHENLRKLLEEKEIEINKTQQQLQKTVNKSLKEKIESATPENTWPFSALRLEKEKSADHDVVRKVGGETSHVSSEKAAKEAEWDAEYEKIVEKNPQFPELFDQALEASVDRYKHLNNTAKKTCLVHEVIELDAAGEVKITEKGKYLAKKIL